MRHIDSEKVVERKLGQAVQSVGGMSIKLACDYLQGLPDRLVLLPGGRVCFVELKTTGKKPRPIQVLMHEKLRAVGFQVEVIDSVEGVRQFINKAIYES